MGRNKPKYVMRKTWILVWSVCLLMAYGCKNNEDNPTPNQNDKTGNLNAVAKVSANTVDVGTQVTLDGTNSEDPDGIGFDASWSFVSKPANSSASINGGSSLQATFTPDEAGDYKVVLTISNSSEGVSDADTIDIMANTPSYIEISGSIDSDKVLDDINTDSTQMDYLVTGDLDVNAVLTIKPGVVLHFKEGVAMYINDGGALIASGDAGNGIVFTSNNVSAGTLWKGINITSTDSRNEISHATISYAGYSEFTNFADFVDVKAAIALSGGGKLKLQNTKVSHSGGYGLYNRYGELTSFTSNNFAQNTLAGIGVDANEAASLDGTTVYDSNKQAVEIFGSTLDMTTNATWPKLRNSAAYYISGNITINSYLGIDAGAQFEVAEDKELVIESGGVMHAVGTSSDKIGFTHYEESTGSGVHWKGISFRSNDAQNELTYTTISYAGNSNFTDFADFVDTKAAVAVTNDAKLNITHTTVEESMGYGMYIRYGTLASFAQNDFTNNASAGVGLPAGQVAALDNATTFTNNNVAVEIYGSTLDATTDATWVQLNGSSRYYVSGDVSLKSYLAIDAGAKFDFAEDIALIVESTGVLHAVGTASNMIEFTSKKASSGIFWKGISFASADARNELTYAKVTYAGNSKFTAFANFVDKKTNIAMMSGAKLTLQNSEVTNGNGYGVYVRYGSFTTFASNTFADNTFADVGLQANQAKSIDGATTFSNNGNYPVEVYNGDNDLSEVSTWTKLSSGAYHILNDLYVENGLTLDPGVKVELDEDVKIIVENSGYFVVNGNASNHIVLTTSNEAGQIRWGGVSIKTGDARNSFDYAEVNYAGGTTQSLSNFETPKTAIGGDNNGNVSITNSTISNSEGYGVYFQGSINAIESGTANNTFTNNPSGNVF